MRTLILALVTAVLASCGGMQTPPPDAPRDLSAEVVETGAVCLAETGGAEQTMGQLNRNVELFLLEGGVTTLLKRTPGSPVVSVRLYVDGGSRIEDPEQSGITSFALDVATSGGTRELSKSDLAAALSSMGSGIGHRVDYDFSTLTLSSLDVYFEDTWALFEQVLDAAVFPESEVELARERHLHVVRSRLEDPDSRVVDAARSLLFAGHSYSNDPLGSVEALTELDRDDLVESYEAMFDSSRMLLVVVGDIDRARLESVVGGTFEGTPASRTRPDPPTPFEVDGPDLMVDEVELPTNYIIGLAPAPMPAEEDYAALRLALSHLSDRLFEEVRTARNLSYAVSAGVSSRMANYSYLYVTTVDPAAALPVMQAEIAALQQTPLSSEDVEELIAGFTTGYYQGIDSTSTIAAELAWWTLYGGGPQNADEFVARVHAVTPADIQRVANAYLANYQFGVVGSATAVTLDMLQSLFGRSAS